MIKSIKFVVNQNRNNLYRIYSIAKADLLDDIKSSKLGLIWNFLSPTIQVLTYWIIFGVVWGRKPVQTNGIEVDYLSWLVAGYACWWFAQPALTTGCRAIASKIKIIETMIFPTSILPAANVCRELFNHLCMCIIAFITLLISGHVPNIYWIQIGYYMFATFCVSEAMTLILSVLTMKARDTHKLVVSLTRMLFYFTPVIWDCCLKDTIPHHKLFGFILKLNPYYYLVNGYRDSIFYNIAFWEHKYQTVYFWGLTLILFVIGCMLFYRSKDKFLNLK